MTKKRPSDYLVSTTHVVSSVQWSLAREPIDHIIRLSMERKLASFIAAQHIERIDGVHQTEFRMKLYVMSADELYELINREAMKIAQMPYDVDLGVGGEGF